MQPVKEASESDENNKVEDPMLKVPILYDPKKLSEKLEAHPHTPAVLIKGQGLFVWAKDFDECILRYFFDFHNLLEPSSQVVRDFKISCLGE